MEITKYEEKETGLQSLQTFEEIVHRVQMVQKVYKSLMQRGTHFDKVPGTNKDTLLKPGAEMLALTFQFAPQFKIERRELSNGHLEFEVLCTLSQRGSGVYMGEGVGMCSTMESKYRYRYQKRKCPKCQNESISNSKAEYGGGYYCNKKAGGCGAKFQKGDSSIESQALGKIDNPDIADQYNTVIKMAKKRAFVDAIITCTACGDIFTQDVEDMEIDITPQHQDETSIHAKGEATERLYKNKPKQEAPSLSEQDKFDKLIDYINQAKGSEPEKMKKALDNAESKLDQFNGPWRIDLEVLIKTERSKLPEDLQPNPVTEAIVDEFEAAPEPQIEDAPEELFDTEGNPV